MVLASVLHRLRAAPAASDKTASFPARQRTVAVQESSWRPMGMPAAAGRGAKHSCATTAEVKILHWGTAQLEKTSPIQLFQVSAFRGCLVSSLFILTCMRHNVIYIQGRAPPLQSLQVQRRREITDISRICISVFVSQSSLERDTRVSRTAVSVL